MSAGWRAASRLGIVSDRRRLIAAAGADMAEAPALLCAQLSAAAAAGVGFFQLREPDLDAAALLDLTRQLLDVANGRTRVVVNDRADVAVTAGADLHLRHESLGATDLRAWLPAATWVSRAVHGLADLDGLGPVDAVIAGTAAPSKSKAPGHSTLGAEGLRALSAASPVPVFAIGGLGPADWGWVSRCGVFGVAAIGAFLPSRPKEGADAAVARAVAAFVAEIDCQGPGY